MTVLFVEVLCVVVTLDVIMMLDDLSAVVFAFVLMTVGCTGVMGVEVFQGKVRFGALVQRHFGHQMAVGAFVVAVIEIADQS